MTRGESTTTLGFLIFPGFPMSCLTSAIEPLRAANEISGQAAFDWKLIGETGARVDPPPVSEMSADAGRA